MVKDKGSFWGLNYISFSFLPLIFPNKHPAVWDLHPDHSPHAHAGGNTRTADVEDHTRK